MKLNQINSLYFFGIVTFIIIVYLFFGLIRRGPSRFRLAGKKSNFGSILQSGTNQSAPCFSGLKTSHELKARENSKAGFLKKDSSELHLNVIFMYNGEEWDAYQILGLPAGSSLLEIENAYLNLKKKTEKLPLIVEEAYRALKKSHS